MGQPDRLLVSRVAVPYIRRHFRRLMRALRGALSAKDPESVHQTRVACRRLRAALGVFKGVIGKKRANRWRRALRGLAQVFGPARDLDVEIAATLGQMCNVGEQPVIHGLAFWLAHLEEQRFRRQRQLVRAVRVFRKSPFVEELNRWIRKHYRSEVSFDPSQTQDHAQISITGEQQKLLSKRLTKLLEAAESLEDPNDIEGHHAMRIAAKKLRYSMEALAPAMGVTSEVALEALRNLQSLLGEIHDYDVWTERIQAVLNSLPDMGFDSLRWLNPDRFVPGLIFLQDKYRSLRVTRFRQLAELWHDEKVQALWKTLRDSSFLPESKEDATKDNTHVPPPTL